MVCRRLFDGTSSDDQEHAHLLYVGRDAIRVVTPPASPCVATLFKAVPLEYGTYSNHCTSLHI